MYVCPTGHMAIHKSKTGAKDPNKPQRESCFFDVKKCVQCPLREKCGYKENQKSKTYNITVKMSKIHRDHQDRQQTEYYQELAGERYKIEAKNAELKKNMDMHILYMQE